MFRRKIYEQMLQWKTCDGARALLIEGAHYVGKTTVAVEFAKREYKSYIRIDFNCADKDVRRYFDDFMEDLDTLFMKLSAAYGVTLCRRESLIIFDNVQCFPRARECVKHLVEDGRFDYMETGCLVSIDENIKDIIIPSEEDSVCMYPLDFEEFCWALGNEKIVEHIRSCFTERISPAAGVHDLAMTLFEQYMIVGGMPQCVERFVETGKDLNIVDAEKREILGAYRDDMNRITSRYKAKVKNVFDLLPEYLSKPPRKVVYGGTGRGTCARNCERPFLWLEDSKMCNFSVCDAREYDVPRCDDKRRCVKCYMGDTGLLFSHAYSESETASERVFKNVLDGNFSLKDGMFLENAVAQMLVSSGYSLSYYAHYDEASHRNDINVDFVITWNVGFDRKICPIMVKSKSSRFVGSLKSFEERYHDKIVSCIVISPERFHVKDDITYIPPYMTCCL